MQTKKIRFCALNHEALGLCRVKVLFKDTEGEESGYWMDKEVYRTIPLATEATLEDYKKLGQVDEALNTDIYSNQ
jgi:hypothetical protein